MKHDGIEFVYKGSNPENEIKQVISAIVEKLHFNSPSDSAMTMVLNSTKNISKATCRIASQTGVFIAEATNKNPLEAITMLETKMRKQLEEWRKSRFI
jgi:ribosome-associated translation inhibitor RaiA